MDDGNLPPENGLADFLCFSVYSASHAFNRIYKPILDELGLTYPQYLAMTLLWQEDNQTVGELGEKLFLESNTLTPLLKRLQSSGLVERVRDSVDERQVRIRLTAKGADLKAEACCVPAQILQATGMTESELRRLTRELSNLRDRLHESAG